jgi:hypothetical protein
MSTKSIPKSISYVLFDAYGLVFGHFGGYAIQSPHAAPHLWLWSNAKPWWRKTVSTHQQPGYTVRHLLIKHPPLLTITYSY